MSNVNLLEKLELLKKSLDIKKLEDKLKFLQEQLSKESVWKDRALYLELNKEKKQIEGLLEKIFLIEVFISEKKYKKALNLIKELEVFAFLSQPYDKLNTYFYIHSGQGGVEAMDWAQMLENMYLKFFEKKGFGVDLISKTYGDEAGIKSVGYLVKGPFAYGLLKNEAGTHRLVRLSPFNANNLRQTSFAKVEVYPQVKNLKLNIKKEDLQIQTFKSSGAGGQNVNKVETAVRIKHMPTGIIVTCQAERSQSRNKQIALDLLKTKLLLLNKQKEQKLRKDLKGSNITASWGTQIRSYVLHPYKQVLDHRTKKKYTNVQDILRGDLDDLIQDSLKKI